MFACFVLGFILRGLIYFVFSVESAKSHSPEPCLKRENSEGYISYSSNGGYTPGVKVEAPAYPPNYPPQAQGQVRKPVTPVDYLPKGQPIPEAFRLQFLHDQKRQDDHVYQNVEKFSKLSLQDGSLDLVSDPKKVAQLGREESEESNNNNEDVDFTKSDPKKVKAIEDFDKGVESGDLEKDSFPASDPKKLAMLMSQDSIVSGLKTAIEVEYENVPKKQTQTPVDYYESGECHGEQGSGDESHYSGDDRYTGEGEEHSYREEDIEIDETMDVQLDDTDDFIDYAYDSEMLKQVAVASHSQPIKCGMLALFDKYQQDIGDSYVSNGEIEEVFDFDLGVEGDDDSESTLTESMADLGENDDELFAAESCHSYENYPPKKEATTTTTETISAHHRKVEFYQNMVKVGGQSEPGEQSDETEMESQTDEYSLSADSVKDSSQTSRAPTEDECYD